MRSPSPLERPSDADWTPIVCVQCLADHRAQRTWLETRSLRLVCPTHGFVYTAQTIAALGEA